MTDTSFSFRLFQAIRANKKGLLAALPTPATYANNDSQAKALQSLINAMFAFEKYARGARRRSPASTRRSFSPPNRAPGRTTREASRTFGTRPTATPCISSGAFSPVKVSW